MNDPLSAFIGAWTQQLGLAIGPEAVAAAEQVDALIVEAGDRIPTTLATVRPGSVNRWTHREEHLDQIENALRRRKA